jgi:hypothetical protein
MSVRYVLALQVATDLVEIWRYIKEQSSLAIADRVETAILEKLRFSRKRPAPDRRKDLTDADVNFFPVYSRFDRLPARDDTFANRLHPSRAVTSEQILKGRL